MEQVQSAAENKRQNAAYLIFLCAVAFFVVARKTDWGLFAAAYPFLGMIAQPGMVFLFGRWLRPHLSDQRRTICAGLGLFLLGYAQKVLVFWAQTVLGQAPVFYPFSTSGVAWVFLTAGTYTVLAGLMHEKRWSTGRVLAVTVALGLLGGLVRPFDSFLCLGQTFAFAPFFVLGCRLEDARLDAWGRDRRWKLPAVVFAAVLAALCLLLRWRLKPFWPIVEGVEWYGACAPLEDAPLLGIPLRLAWYLLSCGLLLALLCLTPSVRLPLFTDQGRRAISAYFWTMPLAYLAVWPVLYGLNLRNLALTVLLMAAVVLLAPSRPLAWLTRWMADAVERARSGEHMAPPERLVRSSFYRRHRWAIQTTALFTACFVAAMVGYVYPFFSNGKSLIWITDGMGQQYPMMFYFKEYILDALERFFTTGTLRFPEWDFSLGFGMSPLDALRREPFMLLALLGNEQTMETIMNLSVLLRLYVCGLSFLWLCAALGRKRTWPAVMGALLYVCSGFAIFTSGRQPYFVTVMMTYLPVMLVGVERYLQRRKWGVFVAIVFLQLIGGYYTAFINGCMMAVYLLIRLGCQYRGDIRRIAAEIGRLIGLYAWGAAMAMMNLLPGILSFFQSAREQGEQSLDLLYSNSYYRIMLTGLPLEFGGAGYWTYISLAAIGWLACILLFLRHRRTLLPYKIGLIALSVFVCVPFFGLVFNGFAYVSNRWSFAFPLLVGLILVEMAPDFLNLTRRDKGVLLVGVLLYCAVVVTRQELITDTKMIGLIVLCMTALVVLLQDLFLRSRRLRMGTLAAVTALTVTINLTASFLPGLGNYIHEFKNAGEAYQSMSGAMGKALPVIEQDESFYRVAQKLRTDNQSMGLGYYGVSAYYSVSPAGVSEYLADICLAAQYQTFRICGLDERAAPTTLAAVKYYVAEGDNPRVPYGFSLQETLEDGVAVYQNDYALPVDYTYTSYITTEEYEQLTALEKQQVMLTSAVIDDEAASLTHGEPVWQQEEITCAVGKLDGVTVDEETRRIDADADGTVELTFEGQPGCETYVVLEGLRYTNPDSGGNSPIFCQGEIGGKSTGYVRGQQQSYYFARDGLIFHLGYSDEAQTSCTLTFDKSLDLSYDDIYVICVPMEDYGAQVSALGETALENVSAGADSITGTLSTQESRLLTFSVPYDRGWHVYVNGEERELLQVNVMYCGVLLEPGEYEIELRYDQPGSGPGTLISAAAVLAIVPVCVVGRLRRKKREN